MSSTAQAIIFCSLSVLAVYTIWGHFVLSGTSELYEAQCPSPPTFATRSQLRYTHIPGLDDFLCILVEFYKAGLESTGRQFVGTFIASFSVPVAVSYIEAARPNTPWILTYPVVYLCICQAVGGGLIVPLYWLLHMRNVPLDGKSLPSVPSKAVAQSIIFGLVVGYAIPSIALYYYDSPYAIAFWQPFPIWIVLAQKAYLLFRPPTNESGYETLRVLYILLFIVTSAIYLSYGLRTFIADPLAPVRALPPLTPPSREGNTIAKNTLNFLKWDGIFIHGSALLVAIWRAHTVRDVIKFVAYSIAFGPAAGITLAWAQREQHCENIRAAAQTPSAPIKKKE